MTGHYIELQEPSDYGFTRKYKLSDLTNVAQPIDWLIQELYGISLVTWIGSVFSGDFPEMYRYRDAWMSLETASYDINFVLLEGSNRLKDNWDGDAADSFYAYMQEWDKALSQLQSECSYWSSKMGALAQSAEELSNAFGDVILQIVNVAVEVVAAVLSVPSGLGLAYALWKMKDAVGDLADGVGTAKSIFTSLGDLYELYKEGFEHVELMDQVIYLPRVNLPGRSPVIAALADASQGALGD